MHGVASELGVILHAHFFQDARTIGADGRHAQMHDLGHFTDGFARRDQTQHLVFTVRESLMGSLFRPALDGDGQFSPGKGSHIDRPSLPF